MGIFSRIFRPRITAEEMRGLVQKSFQAAYYAATSDSKSMDFSFASAVGFNQALCSDLENLRRRCRYELRQNGLAKGLGRNYANSVVCTGPALSIQSDDQSWGESVEIAFSEWARTAEYLRGLSLGAMLHLGVRQFFPCGEYLKLARTDNDAKTPVKLRFLMIRPDRLADPYASTNLNICKGVELNGDGKPVAYHIRQDDPDFAMLTAPIAQYDRIDASKAIHVFSPEDPAQVRGEPWLAQGLPSWHKLRRFDEATISAALVAAKFAAVLVNKFPDIVNDVSKVLPSGVLEIQDGMMMVPPPGYEVQQVRPEHPGINVSDFRRDQIAAAAAGNAIPANIATGDSSRSNFASARYDGVTLELEGLVCRRLLESLDLEPTFTMWLAEAVAVGQIDPPRGDFSKIWRWPKEERHTDPYKAANADRVRVESGLATVGQIWMENGVDQEQGFQALTKEVARWKQMGLAHPLGAKVAPAGFTPADQTTGDQNAVPE